MNLNWWDYDPDLVFHHHRCCFLFVFSLKIAILTWIGACSSFCITVLMLNLFLEWCLNLFFTVITITFIDIISSRRAWPFLLLLDCKGFSSLCLGGTTVHSTYAIMSIGDCSSWGLVRASIAWSCILLKVKWRKRLLDFWYRGFFLWDLQDKSFLFLLGASPIWSSLVFFAFFGDDATFFPFESDLLLSFLWTRFYYWDFFFISPS